MDSRATQLIHPPTHELQPLRPRGFRSKWAPSSVAGCRPAVANRSARKWALSPRGLTRVGSEHLGSHAAAGLGYGNSPCHGCVQDISIIRVQRPRLTSSRACALQRAERVASSDHCVAMEPSGLCARVLGSICQHHWSCRPAGAAYARLPS